MIVRVPLLRPLTVAEARVVELVARFLNYAVVAERLHIAPSTAKSYAETAAAKIPGDWPAQIRCALWWSGASADVLTRAALKAPLLLEGECYEVRRGADGASNGAHEASRRPL